MERILIIGCPGSGKTTLAKTLGQKLGLPVIQLDQLWGGNVTREEFDSRLAMALNMDRWIIDGNYGRTMEARLAKCDTLIYLDYSRWACLLGLARQTLGNEKECVRWETVKWIWNYRKNNRVQNEIYLAKAKHAQSVVLKNRKEVRRFLETI